jgi:hypothetical protein
LLKLWSALNKVALGIEFQAFVPAAAFAEVFLIKQENFTNVDEGAKSMS